MNRRSFLGLLAAIPFVKHLVPSKLVEGVAVKPSVPIGLLPPSDGLTATLDRPFDGPGHYRYAYVYARTELREGTLVCRGPGGNAVGL